MPDSLISANVPEIETQRMILRGHRLEDFADCAAMWADPEVTRHIGGKPLTETEAWTRFLRYAGHWAVMGFGYWALEEKGSGAFVGDVGFADYKREIEPSIKGEAEIGWVLARPFHGKGYATEAVRAALAWGDAHFDRARTVCIIDPGNLGSLKVAGMCGFGEYARTMYKGGPVILLERGKQG